LRDAPWRRGNPGFAPPAHSQPGKTPILTRTRAPATRAIAWVDPATAFTCFAADPGTVFFDSQGAPGQRCRHSILCIDPFTTLRTENGLTRMNNCAVNGDPFALLARKIAKHATGGTGARAMSPSGASGAAGASGASGAAGAAGFIGYDMGATLDRAPRAPGTLAGVPDLQFGFFDTVFTFDTVTHQAFLSAPDDRRADAALSRLAHPPARPAPPRLQWAAGTSRADHIARVEKTLRYIAAGDIYQANIAATFEAERPQNLDPAALYLALRAQNPAPFGAYIDCGNGCAILSVSPERFISLRPDGAIETRPIKGTRPRGADPAADAALAHDLQTSAKDRAENLMIVDLLRNDIARVADRVTVPALCALESFEHVHHLVSTVHGRLKSGHDAVALLRATFPGGSITGAPKLRAMEIIAELERHARGPYCGSAAWIGNDGAMDSNILIRTITVAADRIVAQAGGGIVADSDPAAEWDEVLVKIMPLLLATGTI
jgi:para-aminobenzoate synthetase component 1